MEDGPFLFRVHQAFRGLLSQVLLFVVLLALWWGGQHVYSAIDRTKFPEHVAMPEHAATLTENEKGKVLLDSITNQMKYELNSTFGWSFNDLLFNRFLFDNRAYRQYGVYHATKFLLDLYSSDIAKLGTADRESEFLYRARINQFAIDPRSFWFPSAEGSYKKGFSLLEGHGFFMSTNDTFIAFFSLCFHPVLPPISDYNKY